ncbi:MAG: glycosyltransferase family 2 protein [Pyrinomonadaceae bacterium]
MTSAQSRLGISVFFPAFNDAGSIVQLVKDGLAVLENLTDDYEVLVINDGSTDATSVVLAELTRSEPNVRVIHHERNMGYGTALRTGFRNAKKDLIFYTDGDGQYDVRQLSELRHLLIEGVDVVNGYKVRRADNSSRKVFGAVYNQIARYLFRLPIRDVDCDFRLLRRSIIQDSDLTSSSGAICIELVYKLQAAGAVFVETPVFHYPRVHGESQFFTVGRVVRTVLDCFSLWWRLVGLRHFLSVRDDSTATAPQTKVAG